MFTQNLELQTQVDNPDSLYLVENNDLEGLKELLSTGYKFDKEDLNPFFHAVWGGHLDMAKFLLTDCKVTLPNANLLFWLYLVKDKKTRFEFCNWLLEEDKYLDLNCNITPEHIKAAQGLLTYNECQKYNNCFDNFGFTPEDFAILIGYDLLSLSEQDQIFKSIQLTKKIRTGLFAELQFAYFLARMNYDLFEKVITNNYLTNKDQTNLIDLNQMTKTPHDLFLNGFPLFTFLLVSKHNKSAPTIIDKILKHNNYKYDLQLDIKLNCKIGSSYSPWLYDKVTSGFIFFSRANIKTMEDWLKRNPKQVINLNDAKRLDNCSCDACGAGLTIAHVISKNAPHLMKDLLARNPQQIVEITNPVKLHNPRMIAYNLAENNYFAEFKDILRRDAHLDPKVNIVNLNESGCTCGMPNCHDDLTVFDLLLKAKQYEILNDLVDRDKSFNYNLSRKLGRQTLRVILEKDNQHDLIKKLNARIVKPAKKITSTNTTDKKPQILPVLPKKEEKPESLAEKLNLKLNNIFTSKIIVTFNPVASQECKVRELSLKGDNEFIKNLCHYIKNCNGLPKPQLKQEGKNFTLIMSAKDAAFSSMFENSKLIAEINTKLMNVSEQLPSRTDTFVILESANLKSIKLSHTEQKQWITILPAAFAYAKHIDFESQNIWNEDEACFTIDISSSNWLIRDYKARVDDHHEFMGDFVDGLSSRITAYFKKNKLGVVTCSNGILKIFPCETTLDSLGDLQKYIYQTISEIGVAVINPKPNLDDENKDKDKEIENESKKKLKPLPSSSTQPQVNAISDANVKDSVKQLLNDIIFEFTKQQKSFMFLNFKIKKNNIVEMSYSLKEITSISLKEGSIRSNELFELIAKTLNTIGNDCMKIYPDTNGILKLVINLNVLPLPVINENLGLLKVIFKEEMNKRNSNNNNQPIEMTNNKSQENTSVEIKLEKINVPNNFLVDASKHCNLLKQAINEEKQNKHYILFHAIRLLEMTIANYGNLNLDVNSKQFGKMMNLRNMLADAMTYFLCKNHADLSFETNYKRLLEHILKVYEQIEKTSQFTPGVTIDSPAENPIYKKFVPAESNNNNPKIQVPYASSKKLISKIQKNIQAILNAGISVNDLLSNEEIYSTVLMQLAEIGALTRQLKAQNKAFCCNVIKSDLSFHAYDKKLFDIIKTTGINVPLDAFGKAKTELLLPYLSQIVSVKRCEILQLLSPQEVLILCRELRNVLLHAPDSANPCPVELSPNLIYDIMHCLNKTNKYLTELQLILSNPVFWQAQNDSGKDLLDDQKSLKK